MGYHEARREGQERAEDAAVHGGDEDVEHRRAVAEPAEAAVDQRPPEERGAEEEAQVLEGVDEVVRRASPGRALGRCQSQSARPWSSEDGERRGQPRARRRRRPAPRPPAGPLARAARQRPEDRRRAAGRAPSAARRPGSAPRAAPCGPRTACRRGRRAARASADDQRQPAGGEAGRLPAPDPLPRPRPPPEPERRPRRRGRGEDGEQASASAPSSAAPTSTSVRHGARRAQVVPAPAPWRKRQGAASPASHGRPAARTRLGISMARMASAKPAHSQKPGERHEAAPARRRIGRGSRRVSRRSLRARSGRPSRLAQPAPGPPRRRQAGQSDDEGGEGHQVQRQLGARRSRRWAPACSSPPRRPRRRRARRSSRNQRRTSAPLGAARRLAAAVGHGATSHAHRGRPSRPGIEVEDGSRTAPSRRPRSTSTGCSGAGRPCACPRPARRSAGR